MVLRLFGGRGEGGFLMQLGLVWLGWGSTTVDGLDYFLGDPEVW